MHGEVAVLFVVVGEKAGDRSALRQLENDRLAIASHDEHVINECLKYVKDNGIPPEAFEFQMLYGIRRDLQKRLTRNGFRMRSYVPYGDAWYPYFMRRLAERPANVLFIARNLLRG